MCEYVPVPPHEQQKAGHIGFPIKCYQPLENPSGSPTGQPPVPGFVLDPSPTSPGFSDSTVSPSAPSLDEIHRIEGYENTAFKKEVIAPPPLPEWRDEPPVRNDIAKIPIFTEDDVEEALAKYVSQHCCYGQGVVRSMTVNEIRTSSAFHYTLETFGEKRESSWKFVPYKGQPIDGPQNGPAPGPWEVPVEPSAYFLDGKKKVEVPHTAFVRPCHECVGDGRIQCRNCNGQGQNVCTFCHGTGLRETSACTWCNSSGHRKCMSCHGTGQAKCKTCDGEGNVKGFVQLTVTWKNHYDDYISDTAHLPEGKIRDVTGDVVFGEENPRVWPLINSGDRNISEASRSLVQKHMEQFSNERILRQRHCLRVVPIGEVHYTWKDRSDLFYVYGFENKVHFEKYPQRCCWCCNIL